MEHAVQAATEHATAPRWVNYPKDVDAHTPLPPWPVTRTHAAWTCMCKRWLSAGPRFLFRRPAMTHATLLRMCIRYRKIAFQEIVEPAAGSLKASTCQWPWMRATWPEWQHLG